MNPSVSSGLGSNVKCINIIAPELGLWTGLYSNARQGLLAVYGTPTTFKGQHYFPKQWVIVCSDIFYTLSKYYLLLMKYNSQRVSTASFQSLSHTNKPVILPLRLPALTPHYVGSSQHVFLFHSPLSAVIYYKPVYL